MDDKKKNDDIDELFLGEDIDSLFDKKGGGKADSVQSADDGIEFINVDNDGVENQGPTGPVDPDEGALILDDSGDSPQPSTSHTAGTPPVEDDDDFMGQTESDHPIQERNRRSI